MARLAKKFNPRQFTGVFVSARLALDLALWDIKGKALGQPVARLIGGARKAVPAYATVGLRAYSEAQLINACKKALAEGFHGAKILVGAGRSIAEDAQRLVRHPDARC
jgi:L-rhamnonate dehydratase